MIISDSKREYFTLMYISLLNHCITLPSLNVEPALISGNIQSLIKWSPTSLSDQMILLTLEVLLLPLHLSAMPFRNRKFSHKISSNDHKLSGIF